MGLAAMMGSELEFFLFNQSFEAARAAGYRGMQLASAYNEDYHIFQTTKEEDVMRAVRNGLYGAGVPVECTKGEASAGQEEINVLYAEALECADNHSLVKNGTKEIAWSKGKAVTFMAKWDYAAAGSSSHVHQSLRTLDGRPGLPRPEGRSRHVGHDAPLHGGPHRACRRDHLLPGALHQLLQALPGRHLRADKGRLEQGQPHGGLPHLRRGHQGRARRVPHRRRRPQPLSRIRRDDRRRHRRHRAQARPRGGVPRRRLPRRERAGNPEDPARRRRPC